MRKLLFPAGAVPLIAALAIFVPAPVFADGPGDNLPDKVRPIPPVGIDLDDGTKQRLFDAAQSLAADVDAVASASAADRGEVLVFARAVRLAVEDRFLYSPKEVEQAEQLLSLGRERLEALVQGQRGPRLLGVAEDSAAQPRLAVGGFRSRLDGSIQPYGLVLPAGADLTDGRPRRLDIWLHGRGEKMSEVAFLAQRLASVGEIAPPDTLVLHPYGRYSNAFKFAGEIDVLEAIAHIKTLYAIDDSRVVIRGFSMGGAGCWQLAVHYPGTWMAATPGAGFSETLQFLKGFQREEFQPTPAQARLLHWYDCPDWSNNLRNLPTIAYSGELDLQKQASDAMVEACHDRGFEIPHLIGPQTGHKIHPDSKTAIETFLSECAVRGRPATPRKIDFTTYTLRYPTHTWLTLEGLVEHWQEARVQAAVKSPGVIEITTRNVAALRLDVPKESKVLEFSQPIEVRIDGSSISVPVDAAQPRWQPRFSSAAEGWRRDDGSQGNANGLRKRPGLQGPIDDAFLDPFVFVGPEPACESKAAVDEWVKQEYERAKREWRRHFRGDVVERRAADLTSADIATHNLILFGTPESNPLIAKVMPGLPVRRDGGHWVVGGSRVPAADALPVLIYPNPLNPDRSIVLNSGFTFREYAYLNNARQIPMLPDWAIISTTEGRGAQQPGRILAAGFFDEHWEPK